MFCKLIFISERPETTTTYSVLRSREQSEKRRGRRRAAEDRDNTNKHMASIASSLLHQQICPILIKTLGYSPPPSFSIVSAFGDVRN